MELEIRTMALVVLSVGDKTFCEAATKVEIDDEAGGEFVIVSQDGAPREGNAVAISPEEWPVLREAIDRMIAECRP
jgi:hypothetical protein